MTQEVQKPTQLNLFNLTNPEMDRLANWDTNAQKGVSSYSNSISAFSREWLKVRGSFNKVCVQENGVLSDLVSTVSSINTGLAFLETRSKLRSFNAPDDDIWKVFYYCLTNNVCMWDLKIADLHNKSIHSEGDAKRRVRSVLARIPINEKDHLSLSRIPDWFLGSRDEWENQLDYLKNWSILIEDGNRKDSLDIISDDYFKIGYAEIDEYPDWFISRKRYSSDEQIWDEILEDSQQFEFLRGDYKGLLAKKIYLGTVEQEKRAKSDKWLVELDVSSKVGFNRENISLIEYGLSRNYYFQVVDRFLDHVDTTTQLGVSLAPETLEQVDSLKRFVKYSPEIYASLEHTCTNPENFALWMEDNFVKTTKGLNITDIVPLLVLNSLQLMFKDKDESQQDWFNVRQQNKKLYYFVKNDLKTLVDCLESEDRDNLRDFIDIASGETLEDIIWALAGAFNSSSKQGSELSLEGVKVMGKVAKNTENWVRENYTWVASEMILKLANFRKGSSHQIEVDEQIPIEISQEIEQLQQVVDNAEKDDLLGVNLIYTSNIDNPFNQKYWTQLSRDSESFTDELRDILGNNFPQVIDSSSILSALEFAARTPKEIENTRMRHELSGEERMIKMKRGRMRILYRFLEDHQTLLFHLSPRKWNYES